MRTGFSRRLGTDLTMVPHVAILGIFLFFSESDLLAGPDAALPPVKGASFVLLEDPEVPWKAWGEHEPSGFSFLYDRIGPPEEAPQRLIVLFPGDPSSPCRLEPALREALESRPTLLIQVLLKSDDPFACGAEDPLLDILRSVRQEYSLPPERAILVGEDARSATVLALASNHRTEFGGVMVWEGEPGAALPLNLTQTSIALLGDRRNLNGYSLFLEECRQHAAPIKMNTYWGGVGEFELATDLGEILEWMSSPVRRAPGREISHAAYLPRYGRFGWVWITELRSPGLPGSVSAQWRGSGVIESRPEGVRRFRIKLDSTFDRFGRRVEFVVGRLRLPVTLKREIDGIEFEYSEGRQSWSARFLKFEEPIESPILVPARAFEFAAGEEIPGFAAFLRSQPEIDCAWGARFPHPVPRRALSREDLYCLVPPSPYVVWEETLDRIEAFDAWRREGETGPLEVQYAPGVRANARERPDRTVRALVPFDRLAEWFLSISEPPPDGLKRADTFQHLLGVHMAREHFAPSSPTSSAGSEEIEVVAP